MWKWVLAVAVGLAVAALGAAALFGLKLLRPELLKPDLRQEFAAAGLPIGTATAADVEATFGAPHRTRKEHISTVYEYPDLGLLLRLDDRTGALVWYEFTSGRFATGKGIRVGDSLGQIRAAYGAPTTLTRLSAGTRVRYQFGTAYVLEFWINNEERLGRVVFFRA